jgi:hypothetical protein
MRHAHHMVHLRVDILDAEDGRVRAFFQVGDYPFDNIRLVGLGQNGLCRGNEVRMASFKRWKSQTPRRSKVTELLYDAGGLCCLKLSTIRCPTKETSVRGLLGACVNGTRKEFLYEEKQPCLGEDIHSADFSNKKDLWERWGSEYCREIRRT